MNNKWLKKKKNRKMFIFFGVALILLILFLIGLKEDSSKFFPGVILDAVSTPGNLLSQGKQAGEKNINHFFPGSERNVRIKELEQEIETLRNQLIKNNVTENELIELKNLKNSLNFVEEDYQKSYISASIVAKNDGNYYTSFTVSAGKNQGVLKDSIVLTGKGLVGIVYEVSDNYCKAISILNSKSSVSFELLKNKEYTGIASQNIHIDETDDQYKFINGYLFDMNYKALPGDIVITSGLGLYPKGIPIGMIDRVVEDKSSLLKYVKIKPYVNFKKLEKVMILNPREID